MSECLHLEKRLSKNNCACFPDLPGCTIRSWATPSRPVSSNIPKNPAQKAGLSLSFILLQHCAEVRAARLLRTAPLQPKSRSPLP